MTGPRAGKAPCSAVLLRFTETNAAAVSPPEGRRSGLTDADAWAGRDRLGPRTASVRRDDRGISLSASPAWTAPRSSGRPRPGRGRMVTSPRSPGPPMRRCSASAACAVRRAAAEAPRWPARFLRTRRCCCSISRRHISTRSALAEVNQAMRGLNNGGQSLTSPTATTWTGRRPGAAVWTLDGSPCWTALVPAVPGNSRPRPGSRTSAGPRAGRGGGG